MFVHRIVVVVAAFFAISQSAQAQSVFNSQRGFYGSYNSGVMFADKDGRRLSSILGEFPRNVSQSISLGYRLGNGFDIEVDGALRGRAYEMEWLGSASSFSIAPSIRYTHVFERINVGIRIRATPRLQRARGYLTAPAESSRIDDFYLNSTATILSLTEGIGIFTRIPFGQHLAIYPALEFAGAVYSTFYQLGSRSEPRELDLDCLTEYGCYSVWPTAGTQLGEEINLTPGLHANTPR